MRPTDPTARLAHDRAPQRPHAGCSRARPGDGKRPQRKSACGFIVPRRQAIFRQIQVDGKGLPWVTIKGKIDPSVTEGPNGSCGEIGTVFAGRSLKQPPISPQLI